MEIKLVCFLLLLSFAYFHNTIVPVINIFRYILCVSYALRVFVPCLKLVYNMWMLCMIGMSAAHYCQMANGIKLCFTFRIHVFIRYDILRIII